MRRAHVGSRPSGHGFAIRGFLNCPARPIPFLHYWFVEDVSSPYEIMYFIRFKDGTRTTGKVAINYVRFFFYCCQLADALFLTN